MDQPLPGGPEPRDLHPRVPLDRPFTLEAVRAAGLDRPAFDRLVRRGSVRRLLRGVYASTHAPDGPELRVAAVRLAAVRPGVVVDRTAAWVHGVPAAVLVGTGAGPDPCVPLDLAPQRRSGRHLLGRDLTTRDGLVLTGPLRTALDLGRLLPADRALAAMDALVRDAACPHAALLAELPRFTGVAGVGQLRELAAQVDDRSRSAAESVLRLHWHRARLPTAVPGMTVVTGPSAVRLSLGEDRRQFGAVVSPQPAGCEVTAAGLHALGGLGWRVVVLDEQRVLHGDPELWVRHLEREFHQQLLAQAG